MEDCVALTGILLVGAEKLLNLLADFAVGHLDIVLGGTVVRHEGQEPVVSDVELSCVRNWSGLFFCDSSSYQLVFTTDDVGNLHVVGGWGEIFQLLAGEDIQGGQVDLCVTVFAGLGGGHVDNLAGATLDDNETVLSQGGTLHGEGGRGAGIGGLEGVLMLQDHIVRELSRPY
jgi:hypothetical protein